MKKTGGNHFISALLITVLVLSSVCFPKEIHAEEYGPFASADQIIEVDGTKAYHFADEAISGTSRYIGDSIDFEGFGGLIVKISGTMISYTEYGHNDAFHEGYVYIEKRNNPNGKIVELGLIKKGETRTVDMKNVINELGAGDDPGIYVIKLMIGEDQEVDVCMNLYYDGSSVWTCRINGDPQSIDRWNKLIGNLDPATCLEMYVGNKNYPITYPTSGTNGCCNHVEEWCELSDEIIKSDTWSDEAKVFAMVYWLTQNCAYDNWRVNTNHNTSRATLTGNWTDDSLWMYYNHVGQCWDFQNALTIMCRHQGIPCTSIENEYHTVNAVWLDNEWVAIDVSALVKHACNTEDTDAEKWDKNYNRCSYSSCYGYYDGTMDTYNQCIATPGTTLSTGNGNPV